MKRIIFVRHGKTEAWEFGKNDFDRELTKRGISDCELMAKSLAKENILPQVIHSSSAIRALQTTKLLAKKLNLQDNIILKNQNLYEYVSTQDIQDLVEESDELNDTLMIVGHNPWISSVAGMLSKNFNAMLPTCGIVVLEYKTDTWQDVQPGKGKIIYYKTPKAFK